MPTTQDYRAGLLYAYRVFRRDGYAPRRAYHMAKVVTKPLPEDREAVLLRNATKLYRERHFAGHGVTARGAWLSAWQYVRENL